MVQMERVSVGVGIQLLQLVDILALTTPGVYISQKLDIFAPPPFQDHIFSPKYSENFPFFPFVNPFPHYISLFTK